jgi:hypothetical protein
MKRERTFQRRAKRLIEREKGKGKVQGFKLQKGVWFFPSETEARELIEEAKDCGLKEGKSILLFLDMKPLIASKELMEAEIQAERETKKFIKEFMTAGLEHQKQGSKS